MNQSVASPARMDRLPSGPTAQSRGCFFHCNLAGTVDNVNASFMSLLLSLG